LGVDRNGLARPGRARDKEMGHAGEIDDDRLAADHVGGAFSPLGPVGVNHPFRPAA
jgi:hypothetical protein